MEQTNQENSSPVSPQNNINEPKLNIILPAVLAYILFFLPLFFRSEVKNHPFVKFHTKQGFILFVFSLIVSILGYVPTVSGFVWILSLANFVLFIIGVLNVFGKKEKELPVIGQFAKEINFL